MRDISHLFSIVCEKKRMEEQTVQTLVNILLIVVLVILLLGGLICYCVFPWGRTIRRAAMIAEANSVSQFLNAVTGNSNSLADSILPMGTNSVLNPTNLGLLQKALVSLGVRTGSGGEKSRFPNPLGAFRVSSP
jgi:hypothetical protein